jgi:predicted heme/steroid binding protein
MKQAFAKLRTITKRYPLLVFAVILGAGMVGASLAFSSKVENTAKADFDPSRVLPQAVSIPAASAVFTAETIKQYDGKDGHKCYVAVKGTVYEISGKTQWQGGQHLPSNGQAYCGADLTDTIGKSPHGESKLQELPKVGTYKAD